MNNKYIHTLLGAIPIYIVVILCMYIYKNAVFALLAYHASIAIVHYIYWLCKHEYSFDYHTYYKNLFPKNFEFHLAKKSLPLLLVVLAGVVLYIYMSLDNTSAIISIFGPLPIIDFLETYKITHKNITLLLLYFAFIHPIIEQSHWRILCSRAKNHIQVQILHILFAGYHILVLAPLMQYRVLILVFIMLFSMSWYWHHLYTRRVSLAIFILSHIMADLSIAIVVLMQYSLL